MAGFRMIAMMSQSQGSLATMWALIMHRHFVKRQKGFTLRAPNLIENL